MSKASEIINDALEYLYISSGLMGADPDQEKRAYKTLLRVLDSLSSRGIQLYYIRPASPVSEMYEPPWATEYLMLLLAKAVAPYFQAETGMQQVEAFDNAERVLLARTMQRVQLSYPEGMPMGLVGYGGDAIYASGPSGAVADKAYDMNVNEVRNLGFDYHNEASTANASLVSSTWESIGQLFVVASNPTFSGTRTEVTVTLPSLAGEAWLKNTVTFDNGEVYVKYLVIRSVDASVPAYWRAF